MFKEIAKKYNVSRATVQRFATEHKLKRKRFEINKEELISMFEKYVNYTTVAKELGITEKVLRKRCEYYDLFDIIKEIKNKLK